jgi:DNA-binding protein H-NS
MATRTKNVVHVSDCEGMLLEELVDLQEGIDKLITKKRREKKKEIKAQMTELAKIAGYGSVEEFIGGSSTRAPRKDKGVKAPPMYKNPKDPEQTWSGKGRTPDWIKDYEKKGGKRDKLKIK